MGIPNRLELKKPGKPPIALNPRIYWISGTKKDVRGRL